MRLHVLWLLRRGELPVAVVAAVCVRHRIARRLLQWYREVGAGKPFLLTETEAVWAGSICGSGRPIPSAACTRCCRSWEPAEQAAASPHASGFPGSGGLKKGGLRQRLASVGLLSGTERKNGWQLAEVNGDADPYGIQYLLNRARWSVAVARTALCDYVQEYLGDAQAVGIIDETAFLKKGAHSAGVARQDSGTAGRGGNCQVGVFLAYAGARGYTLLDAELHLPEGWTSAPARLQAVGLAPDTPFATKPQLAQRLLARAQAAGVSLAWVVGDTVHGRWRSGTRPTCWRCRPTKRSWSAGTSMWWGRCMRPWSRRTGSGSVRGRAARANGGTTGSAWCWPKGRTRTRATACCSGAPAHSRRSGGPISCGAPRPATCPPWSGSPAAAGVSSRPLRWPSRRWAWTSTRCATPGAGTAT
ncbi:MAG: transposase [Caldilineaceae bacterium]|nr:transposase [Caldilineaceae bacterium]